MNFWSAEVIDDLSVLVIWWWNYTCDRAFNASEFGSDSIVVEITHVAIRQIINFLNTTFWGANALHRSFIFICLYELAAEIIDNLPAVGTFHRRGSTMKVLFDLSAVNLDAEYAAHFWILSSVSSVTLTCLLLSFNRIGIVVSLRFLLGRSCGRSRNLRLSFMLWRNFGRVVSNVCWWL